MYVIGRFPENCIRTINIRLFLSYEGLEKLKNDFKNQRVVYTPPHPAKELRGDGRKNSYRNSYFDALKGIGILLVVIGHNVTDQTFIFCFHMPLFFLISGFLFSPKPLRKYLKKSFFRLLIPYISFLLVISLPDFVTLLSKWNVRETGFLISRLLYGGVLLKGIYAVFWYITVLWVSANLFNLIITMHVKVWMLPLLILIAYLTSLIPYPLPWNIQVVPMATSYIWIGYILKQKFDTIKMIYADRKLLIVFLAVFVLIVIYICRENLTIDMKYNNMGIPVLSLISSILASISVAVLTILVTRSKIITKLFVALGGGSMVVMYLHMPIKFYLVGHIFSGKYIILNIILGICISMIIFFILRRDNWGKKYLLGEW